MRSPLGLSSAVLAFATVTVLLTLAVTLTSAATECEYCGPEELCTLPYKSNPARVKKCDKACLKFDGRTDDGNGFRVVVRDCATPEHYDLARTCKEDAGFHGARGTLCVCESEKCNGVDAMRPTFAVVIAIAVAVTLRMM